MINLRARPKYSIEELLFVAHLQEGGVRGQRPLREDASFVKSRRRGRALGLCGWASLADIPKASRKRFPVDFPLGLETRNLSPLGSIRGVNFERVYMEGFIRGFCPPEHYYHEPGTGRKFGSLLSVQRYLAEQNENDTLSETLAELKEYNMPLSRAFKIGSNANVRNK
ncbi:hypothetical protein AgCh_003565 [Apium graveolens]